MALALTSPCCSLFHLYIARHKVSSLFYSSDGYGQSGSGPSDREANKYMLQSLVSPRIRTWARSYSETSVLLKHGWPRAAPKTDSAVGWCSVLMTFLFYFLSPIKGKMGLAFDPNPPAMKNQRCHSDYLPTSLYDNFNENWGGALKLIGFTGKRKARRFSRAFVVR